MFKIFYLIFVVSIIFGGSIYVGPATMRQYMSVMMFVMCIPHLDIIWKSSNKLIALFFAFLFCYLLSAINENSIENFIREFIAYYMVGIAAFFSTIIYIKEKGNANNIVTVFLICGVLNGIATYLQSIQHPVGLAVGSFFGDMEDEITAEKFSRIKDGSSLLMWGMMGNAVFNGYLSMMMPLLSLELFSSKILINHKYLRIISLILLFLFFIYTLFLVQERAPFFFTCLLLFIHSVRFLQKRKFIIPIIISILLLLGSFLMNSEIIRESRFINGEETEPSRFEIASKTCSFIFDNLLLGGKIMAYDFVGRMPHNFILSSFIYAGLIGGVVICGIVFYQLLIAWRLYRKKICTGIVLAFIGYTFNGLLHNPALVTGDVILWILWGIIWYEYCITRRRNYAYYTSHIR